MTSVITSKKAFNNIVLGFFFHLIGQTAGLLLGNDYVLALLCSIGWLFILMGVGNIRKTLNNPFRGGYRVLYSLYFILTAVMVVRGYLIDYPFIWLDSSVGFINCHLFSPTYILCYAMPLAALIPTEAYSLKKYCKYSSYWWLFYIFCAFFLFSTILSYSAQKMLLGGVEEDPPLITLTGFSLSLMFVLLCKQYTPKKQFVFSLIGFIAAILVNVVSARRGGLLSQLCIVTVIIYTLTFKSSLKKTGTVAILFVILLIFFYISYINSDIFAYLFERGLEDTREGVDEALLSQMNGIELLFGKGLNGRYYYPLGGPMDELYNGYRYGSETGFYCLVLRGGYIYAILYILLLLIPSLKGLFKSNNILCKSLALIILLSLIELYPHGYLQFDLKFLVIWMGVRLCMSTKFRRLNNSEVYEKFFIV